MKVYVNVIFFIATILLSGLCVSGCNMLTTQHQDSNSKDNQLILYQNVDPSLKTDDVSFFSESGAQACATGGVLGTITCLLVGGNNEACLLAMAVSCAVGMGTNYLLEKIRDSYATKEEQLDAVTKEVKIDNEKVEKLIERSKTILAKDQQELADIKKFYKKKKVNKDRIEEKVRYYDNTIDYLKKQQTLANERLKEFKETKKEIYKDNNLIETDNNIAVMNIETEITKTENNINEMSSIISDFITQRDSLKLIN
ncbi:MAG: hypothetical protein ACI4V7_08765 [Succinivibrionaceae bacterium]